MLDLPPSCLFSAPNKGIIASQTSRKALVGRRGSPFCLRAGARWCVVLPDSETEESDRCGVVNSVGISSKIGSRSMRTEGERRGVRKGAEGTVEEEYVFN